VSEPSDLRIRPCGPVSAQLRCDFGKISQLSHRNSTKTLENWAFLTFLCARGWDEPLFLAMQFKTANKINGFKTISYGMAVKNFENTA
jgi:hypothetical protein